MGATGALRLISAVALNATAIRTDRRYLDMPLLRSKEVATTEARESEQTHDSCELHT